MESFNKCIVSLNTTNSDSERLAALMIICKVCDEINKEQAHQLFEAVTPKFLVRLMKTESPERSMLKTVALNILVFFSNTIPEIFLQEEQLVNVLFEVLNPASETENSSLYMDTLHIIYSIASLEKGANILVEKDLFSLFEDLVLKEDYTEKVVPVFQCLLIHNNTLNKDFIKYLICASSKFQTNQDIVKFRYLKVFIKLFQNITDRKFQINDSTDEELKVIIKNICLACKDIMQSHVKADLKRSVIILLCYIMKSYGNEWILDKQYVQSGDFIILLLTVISVELSFLFHSNINENESDELAVSVTSGLHITQTTLNLICSNSFECCELVSDNDFILKVFSCFKNVMLSVYEYLLSIDQQVDNIQLRNTVLISALSMASTWATEETQNLRDELKKALPIMMKVGKKDLDYAVVNGQPPLILDMLTPCFSQILAEKEMRKVLLTNDFHNLYGQYLLYYFSSEAYIKRPGYLDALVHIIHQLTILEPKLCQGNSCFKDISVELVKFVINLPNAFPLSSYSCLEIITVMLALLRICEIEYGHSLEHALRVSIQLVYQLSEKLVDGDILDIWFISVQNIFAYIGMHEKLVGIFKDDGYLKGFPGKVSFDKDMKGSIHICRVR